MKESLYTRETQKYKGVAMSKITPIKSQAYQIIGWQLAMIVGLAGFIMAFRGMQHGVSVLLGGLAYWFPTLAFVWRIFRRSNLSSPQQFVVIFFAGEIFKLLLSAILFLLIVKNLSVNVLSTLIGFAGAIAAFWIASFLFINRHPGVRP